MGLVQGVSCLSLLLYLVTGILFIIWFQRAYGNLATLGQSNSHGVGWSIGGWFVPFYNLYKPGAIGVDLLRKSREAASESSGVATARWWWGLYVALSIWSSIESRIWMSESISVESSMLATVVLVVIEIAAAILATALILRVDAAQHRARRGV